MSHYLSAKVEYRTYSRKFFESFASAKIYLHCARIIKFLKFVISVFTYVRWADNVDDMKRIIVTLVMGFSFLGLFGQTNKFMTVGVNEFEKFIADTTVTLLDVRTPAEHAEGFIPGTHFNIDVLEETYIKTATDNLPKDRPVALYCRSGNRSKNAARILAEKGYEVVELGSGFRGWVAAGKAMAKPE